MPRLAQPNVPSDQLEFVSLGGKPFPSRQCAPIRFCDCVMICVQVAPKRIKVALGFQRHS